MNLLPQAANKMRVYLACFDISNDRIRTRVGKLLLRYGERVQYSVFEIAIKRPEDLAEIKFKIQEIIASNVTAYGANPDYDHDEEDTDGQGSYDVRFYYLNAAAREQSSDLFNQSLAQFPAAVVV